MKQLNWLIALGLGASLACSKSPDPGSTNPAAPSSEAQSEVLARGAPLQGAQKVTLQTLVSKPKEYEGKTVNVSGTARRVCQAMGCWMELATSSDKSAPGFRIAFKDHAFFVPKDAAGKAVTAEGVVQLKQLSKRHVDHYEAEGAVFQSKNPDGSANELRLVASGVELR